MFPRRAKIRAHFVERSDHHEPCPATMGLDLKEGEKIWVQEIPDPANRPISQLAALIALVRAWQPSAFAAFDPDSYPTRVRVIADHITIGSGFSPRQAWADAALKILHRIAEV